MKRILLLYNPLSGQKRTSRASVITKAADVFRSAGVQVEQSPTTHAGSAVEQTEQAVAAGFDTVIACGGDGTANEVVNGLMRSGSRAALGVIPLGSGNLLATDLRLPVNPVSAAQALLRYSPSPIRPGTITSQDDHGAQSRYFIVAAGVGADADLMYRTAVEVKERWGRKAYFIEMARMALRPQFPMFQVEWAAGGGQHCREKIALVMAIRAEKFPGLLRRVRLGSSLRHNHYRLLLFKTDRARHFVNYFASIASGFNWSVPNVKVVSSDWFRCTPLEARTPAKIHAECDGELLGRLPAEVGIAEKSFQLLMP
ncbi:MAG TPA: diacylglycerol kinase family protein [Candidatus Angelobacter sp.]|nr:diacylglycerol kinase family protein [Candidatus Angelobacter sp.]